MSEAKKIPAKLFSHIICINMRKHVYFCTQAHTTPLSFFLLKQNFSKKKIETTGSNEFGKDNYLRIASYVNVVRLTLILVSKLPRGVPGPLKVAGLAPISAGNVNAFRRYCRTRVYKVGHNWLDLN